MIQTCSRCMKSQIEIERRREIWREKQSWKDQCGKYERANLKNNVHDSPLHISVFLVASILKDKSSKLLTEARGLDDVVKVNMTLHFRFLYPYYNYPFPSFLLFSDIDVTGTLVITILQILNDITGNLDAKKACTGAMEVHKKYLKKVNIHILSLFWSNVFCHFRSSHISHFSIDNVLGTQAELKYLPGAWFWTFFNYGIMPLIIS